MLENEMVRGYHTESEVLTMKKEERLEHSGQGLKRGKEGGVDDLVRQLEVWHGLAHE